METEIKPAGLFQRWLFAACLVVVSTNSADSWRLTSQTWLNLLGQGAVFSPYDYDAQGHRVQRRDYNSQDSSGLLVSHTQWEYDALDRPSREISFSGPDTVSILVREFDLHGEAFQESITGPGGKLRYRDSMSYDQTGLLKATVRYSGSGSVLFARSYSLDTLLDLESDTTWQPQGGLQAVVATQTQSSLGRVSWIQQWSRELGGTQWNPTVHTEMAYNGSLLGSVTNLDGDGSGRVLLDSTVFANDQFGNRLWERTYNYERVASTFIQYNWIKVITAGWLGRAKSTDGIKVVGNRLIWNQAIQAKEIFLMDAKGRMVVRWTNLGSTEVNIPSSISTGTYFAFVKNGGAPLVCALTLSR